jgi:hypothetical protein
MPNSRVLQCILGFLILGVLSGLYFPQPEAQASGISNGVNSVTGTSGVLCSGSNAVICSAETTYLNGLYAQLGGSNLYANGTTQTTGLSASTAGFRITPGALPSIQVAGNVFMNPSGVAGVSDGTNANAVITFQGSGTAFGTNPATGSLGLWAPNFQQTALAFPGGTTTFLRGDGTFNAPSSSGANTALSNLASVAINTSLIPAADNTQDLGTNANRWGKLFIANGLRAFSSDNAIAADAIFASGNAMTRITSGFFQWGSTVAPCWSSGSPTSAACDVGLARNAAGIAEVNNGTPGTVAPLITASGSKPASPTPTDPGCTTGGHIGRFWIDNTSSVVTHFKVCAEVASSPTWVTVF